MTYNNNSFSKRTSQSKSKGNLLSANSTSESKTNLTRIVKSDRLKNRIDSELKTLSKPKLPKNKEKSKFLNITNQILGEESQKNSMDFNINNISEYTKKARRLEGSKDKICGNNIIVKYDSLQNLLKKFEDNSISNANFNNSINKEGASINSKENSTREIKTSNKSMIMSYSSSKPKNTDTKKQENENRVDFTEFDNIDKADQIPRVRFNPDIKLNERNLDPHDKEFNLHINQDEALHLRTISKTNSHISMVTSNPKESQFKQSNMGLNNNKSKFNLNLNSFNTSNINKGKNFSSINILSHNKPTIGKTSNIQSNNSNNNIFEMNNNMKRNEFTLSSNFMNYGDKEEANNILNLKNIQKRPNRVFEVNLIAPEIRNRNSDASAKINSFKKQYIEENMLKTPEGEDDQRLEQLKYDFRNRDSKLGLKVGNSQRSGITQNPRKADFNPYLTFHTFKKF
eukprot:CAMPEP_0170528068 /NCGR_PEP_ID=MMETSP0209-20121228/13565_1 /TAXON_ID=665100 ORGANISM="Litonotus pictus, Strain P1" /NCGR_SAMPLE_ID=MMETSP0209 /ASSEMBLY_ACC=CAM_ASM_000301 /LENGTH=455 /DNA_ID=CAMNT_0010819045 /DNA_START=272 /DNA_END=1636 /DNA_ORIENTATION=-